MKKQKSNRCMACPDYSTCLLDKNHKFTQCFAGKFHIHYDDINGQYDKLMLLEEDIATACEVYCSLDPTLRKNIRFSRTYPTYASRLITKKEVWSHEKN